MTDAKAERILAALAEDESRPRYCSDAGAADLHRMNAEAIKFALVAIADRAAMLESIDRGVVRNVNYRGLTMACDVEDAARRHMRGEP